MPEAKAISPAEFFPSEEVDLKAIDPCVLAINTLLRAAKPDLRDGKSVTIPAPEWYVEANKKTRLAVDQKFQAQGWSIRFEQVTERRPGGTTTSSLTMNAPTYRGG